MLNKQTNWWIHRKCKRLVMPLTICTQARSHRWGLVKMKQVPPPSQLKHLHIIACCFMFCSEKYKSSILFSKLRGCKNTQIPLFQVILLNLWHLTQSVVSTLFFCYLNINYLPPNPHKSYGLCYGLDWMIWTHGTCSGFLTRAFVCDVWNVVFFS